MTERPEFGLGYPGTDLRRRLVDAVLAGDKIATAGLYGEEPPTKATTKATRGPTRNATVKQKSKAGGARRG